MPPKAKKTQKMSLQDFLQPANTDTPKWGERDDEDLFPQDEEPIQEKPAPKKPATWGPRPVESVSDEPAPVSKPFGEKSYGEKSYGEKSYGEKSYGEKSYGEKSYGEKSYGEKSYGERHAFGDRAPRVDKELDLSLIPAEGPYVLKLFNLAYSVTRQDVEEYFGDFKIANIVLPFDKEKGQIKGFGFVAFETFEDLQAALKRRGADFHGRALRMDLVDDETAKRYAQRQDSRPARGGFGAGFSRPERRVPDSIADADNNWRTGKSAEGGSSAFGGFRKRGGAEGEERRGRGGYGRGRGGYGRGGYGRGGFRNNGEGEGEEHEYAEPKQEEPQERPKLNLKPRTVEAPVGTTAGYKGENPFGGKPREEKPTSPVAEAPTSPVEEGEAPGAEPAKERLQKKQMDFGNFKRGERGRGRGGRGENRGERRGTGGRGGRGGQRGGRAGKTLEEGSKIDYSSVSKEAKKEEDNAAANRFAALQLEEDYESQQHEDDHDE